MIETLLAAVAPRTLNMAPPTGFATPGQRALEHLAVVAAIGDGEGVVAAPEERGLVVPGAGPAADPAGAQQRGDDVGDGGDADAYEEHELPGGAAEGVAAAAPAEGRGGDDGVDAVPEGAYAGVFLHLFADLAVGAHLGEELGVAAVEAEALVALDLCGGALEGGVEDAELVEADDDEDDEDEGEPDVARGDAPGHLRRTGAPRLK